MIRRLFRLNFSLVSSESELDDGLNIEDIIVYLD